jgi:hypothetical protein
LLVARTPDRRHHVEIVELDGRAALGIDGRRGAEFEAIVASTLTFDAAGQHVAYAVKEGGRYRLARDHCPGPPFDGIGDIVFSSGGERLAYAASLGSRWAVVVDAAIGPLVDAVLAGTLGFGGDGAHVLYAARVDGGARVFVDHAPGPLADAVGQLRLPRDGRVGYVARRDSTTFVVRGDEATATRGRVGAFWVGEDELTSHAEQRDRGWALIWKGGAVTSSIDAPELAGSDDGRHVAWLGRDAAGARVWLDGAPFAGPFARVRSGSLTFAPAQKTPSFVAEGVDGRPRAVIAGIEQPVLDRMGALVFSADGRHWACAGARGAEHLLLWDGAARALRGPIADPVLSPAGDRVAFVPLASPGRVVVDGREHAFPLVLPDTLAFGRDGRHWAVVAGHIAERRLYFVIDGTPGPALDFEELISSVAGADAKATRVRATLLREWAAATADAVSSPARDAAWLSGRCERR